MAKLKLPFELEKPSSNEYVTQASQIGWDGQPLTTKIENALKPVENIDNETTQSEEDALVFETDGGTQVGKIDANGADFVNLKRGGQQVARMSDLPTKDTSIGDSPSTTNVPTTKAVKDYVDEHSGGDFPIEKETTQSDTEEQVWGNDAETQEYSKIGNYGIKSKAYLDMQGQSIIDSEVGDNPSTSHAPSVKAVKEYVDAHGGGYWNGKNVYFFGDSVSTAAKMTDMIALKNILKLANLESRSIGGQRYGWNGRTNPSDATATTNGGSICWVRPDGSLIARNDSFNYDTFDGVSYPSGVTAAMVEAGTAIPVRGSACSWLRITKMFPSSIKDNVDAVLLFYHNDSLPVDTALSWVNASTADPEWAADATYYNGGDYNIDCLNGGIASAIMKLQIWMPNATIILCTPVNSFGQRGENHFPDYTYTIDGVTLSKRVQADAVIEAGEKFATPVADVYGESGINTMNRTTFVPDNDTIHPNALGNDRIAKTIAMKLITVYPH